MPGRHLTDAERVDLVEECFVDPVMFCQVFLQNLFYLEMPWVHRGMLAILLEKTEFLLKYGELGKIVTNFVHKYEDGSERQIFHVFIDGERLKEDAHIDEFVQRARTAGAKVEIKLDLGSYTLLMMPRGSSKTTLAGLAVPLYKILYKEDKFTLYVSKADKHSQGQLESVKRQLTSNELIHECFGDLQPRRSDDERWAKEKFETKTGIAMQAKGKGSAIRGINHNSIRPSTIIVDDPQSRSDVKSDSMREEDIVWAFSELTPARAQIIGNEGSMIVLGTYLGPKCLVDVWSRDPKWTVIKFGVKDRDGDWLWPAYMDQKKHDAEKASFSQAGQLSFFYKEYYNEEVHDGTQPFPSKFIQYGMPADDEPMAYATFADLAISEKRTADFSAICTVGMSIKGYLYLVEMWLERGPSEEDKAEEYFRQSMTWKSMFHGFESNAYQAVFASTLKEMMFRKNHYFEVIPVAHKTAKITRVMGGLRFRYAGGYIYHRVPFSRYEGQLYDFREDNSHEHDDGPDAMAACVTLLDPVAAYAADEDLTADDTTSIEELCGGEWRQAV